MRKTAVYTFLFITLSAGCMNMSVHDNKIYFLDSFISKLYIFDDNGSPIQTVCLKNISRSGFYDYFIKRDSFNSLVYDSLNESMYVLDEEYKVRRSVSLKDIMKKDIIPKLFPVGSNSVILSSSDNLGIFILRNNGTRMIIFSDSPYSDFFSDGKNIFLLFSDHISKYSISGVFIKNIPLPLEKIPYSSLYVTSSNIFLKNPYGIVSLKKDLSEIGFLEDSSVLSYTGIGSTLYYFTSNSSIIELWSAEN